MKLAIKQSTLICLVSGLFLIGLVVGRRITITGWVVLAAAIMTIAVWRWRALRVPLLLVATVAFGIYRGDAAMARQHWIESNFGQQVVVRGQISDDPYLDNKGYEHFTIGGARLNGQSTSSNIAVFTHSMRVSRGYHVQVTAKLQSTLGAAVAETSFGDVVVTSTQQSWLERLRQRFFGGMRTALPEPLSSFGLGLLIGVRALIPKNLQTQLAVVGLSHLVAVSGYNLTILVNAASRLLGRRFKFGRLAASLWLIAGFVVVSGSGASIVRAALVSIMVLITSYYGRTIKPLVLVLVAAALTAGFNPNYLYRDIGWQLSFLAFTGILVIAPLIMKDSKRFLAGILVESLLAFIVTAPLIAYDFGTFSVVAPLANLIVLPLVPFAMLASFVAGLAGMFMPLASGWLALPALWLLRLMLGVINWLDHARVASLSLHVSLGQFIVVYVVMVVITAGLSLRRRASQIAAVV